MNDNDQLAAGLVFGGLDPAEEAYARDLEATDAQFAALVSEYADTSAFLAISDLPEAPSQDISDRILAIPDELPRLDTRPRSDHPEPTPSHPAGFVPGVVSLDEVRRETTRWKRTAFALAGIGVAASIGVGVVLVGLMNEQSELREQVTAVQSESADLNRLMLADDLSIAEASLPGDENAKITVMASVNEGLVRVQTSNVAIPDGQDMQMWLLSADGAEPMGLIDPANPAVDSLPIPDGAELGFTMEPEGGSESLEGPPVVSIKF